MKEEASAAPNRLDSWKAIADYLGRDVATVRRWERLHQLPVRRIAGPGRSVFAYVNEIDEWLRQRPASDLTKSTVAPTESVIEAVPPVGERHSSHARSRWPILAAGVLVASGLLWGIPLFTSAPSPTRGEFITNATTNALVAFDQSGREAWRYPFSPEKRVVRKATYSEVRVLSGSAPGVIAATSYYELFDKNIKSGELLWFTPNGTLAKTFAFDDHLVFGGKPFTQPWVLTDFSVNEASGHRRIAVSARDNNWWPSLVTVLDDRWRRTATFVNTGWIQQVHWLSADTLLISGFANPFDGGMVALLNLKSLSGQSPPSDDPQYGCPLCGAPAATRYVVFPRSEVNIASGATLNEAVVAVQDERVIVHTIEVNREAESVEAIYEFSPSLELLRAGYGDRYWEMHKSLEAEGRIKHTREQCPDRNGPRALKIWEAGSGWTSLK